MVQNSKGKTSTLAHPVAAHSNYVENVPGRAFRQQQIDKFSLTPEDQFDRKALLAALNAYIAQKVQAKNLGGISSLSRTQESPSYTSRLKPPHIDHLDGAMFKEKTGDFEMNPAFLQRPISGLRLGSSQSDLRIPLTPVDGKACIYTSFVCICT